MQPLENENSEWESQEWDRLFMEDVPDETYNPTNNISKNERHIPWIPRRFPFPSSSNTKIDSLSFSPESSPMKAEIEGMDGVCENAEALLEVLRMEHCQEKLRAQEEIQQLKKRLAFYEKSNISDVNSNHAVLKEQGGQPPESANVETSTAIKTTDVNLSLDFDECLKETLALLDEEFEEWQMTTTTSHSNAVVSNKAGCLENITNQLSPSPQKRSKSMTKPMTTTPPPSSRRKAARQKELVRSLQRLKSAQRPLEQQPPKDQSEFIVDIATNTNPSIKLDFDKEISSSNDDNDVLVGLKVLDQEELEQPYEHSPNNNKNESSNGHDQNNYTKPGLPTPQPLSPPSSKQERENEIRLGSSSDNGSSSQGLPFDLDPNDVGELEEEVSHLRQQLWDQMIQHGVHIKDSSHAIDQAARDNDELEEAVSHLRQQLWDQMIQHGVHVKNSHQAMDQATSDNEELRTNLQSIMDEKQQQSIELQRELASNQELKVLLEQLQAETAASGTVLSNMEMNHQRQLNDLQGELERHRELSQKQLEEHERDMSGARKDLTLMQAKMASQIADSLDSKNKLRQEVQVLKAKISALEYRAIELERQNLDAQMQIGIARHARLSMSVELETAMERMGQQTTSIENLQQQLQDAQRMTRIYSNQVDILGDDLQHVRMEARESLEGANRCTSHYRMDLGLIEDDLNRSFSCMM